MYNIPGLDHGVPVGLLRGGPGMVWILYPGYSRDAPGALARLVPSHLRNGAISWDSTAGWPWD